MFEMPYGDSKKRLMHTLWMLMSHNIHRYLMCNTKGRLDGSEKADQHEALVKVYLASRFFCHRDAVRRTTKGNDAHRFVHDETQELTAYMDEQIGFPIDDTRPDYDKLAPLFFIKFIEMADNALAKFQDMSGA